MPIKVDNKWVFTDEELDEQFRNAELAYDEYVKDKPIASSYVFDPETRILSIRTDDGSRVDFAVSKIRELRNASTEQIREAYITRAGDAIHWDNLDAHYTIAGLAARIFGTKKWMAELGSQGGKVRSEAKAKAARSNGARGGRPASPQPSTAPNYFLVISQPVREYAQAATYGRIVQTKTKKRNPKVILGSFQDTVATTTNKLCQV